MLPRNPVAFANNIQNILHWSRSWNAANETTGALMCSNGRFAQSIEGPASVIKATFGHISLDRRHKNLQLLDYGAIRERVFVNWSMAYTAGTDEPHMSLTSLDDTFNLPDSRAIVAMLRHLVLPDMAM